MEPAAVIVTQDIPALARGRSCIACDRPTEHNLLWEKNGSRVFRCVECGLGSATRGNFDPTRYYTADFFNGNTERGYPDYINSENVLRSEFRALTNRLRQIVPSGTLLEIGAAYGFFLLEANAYYRVHGVELADEAAAFARARGLDVRTGGLTRQILEQIGPIDVVVMLDVIEHLDHPRATLALCGEFLAPGGVVLLTTPDFASAFARITGKRWRNMTPPQHLWYFTRDSIAGVAATAGLELFQISHPWKHVPISLVAQLIGRCIGVEFPRAVFTSLSKVGISVNLFDVMRVVLRKPRYTVPI
ncbi:MAG: class I SAM-dependent methyltransferase [Alphaproteobacteria bacterium]|nr:class I SAM-dependent methyltransferase [Alphaproteobacteria bacterium]